MMKYFCDICEKEVKKDKLILQQISFFETGEFIEMNLCKKCWNEEKKSGGKK